MFSPTKKNQRDAKAAKIELLEARVLYSADLLTGSFGVEPEPDLPDRVDLLSELASASNDAVSTLVFIDSRTPDYDYFLQHLEKGSSPQLKVVLLDHTQSGVEQISSTLSSLDNIQSIHIVSHNIGDGIALGADIVDANFVSQHSAEFNQWATALTNTADLLLYGCNLAASENGDKLIALLASTTGADIAASNNLTGSSTHHPDHADWQLEVSSGSIETELFLEEGLLNDWPHTLATITVTTPNDVIDAAALNVTDLINNPGGDNEISLREAIVAANRTPGADTIVLDADTYSLQWAGDGTPEDAGLQDDLDVTDELTILGQGPGFTAIDGSNSFRVLDVHNSSLTLKDLSVKGGLATGPDNGAGLLVNGGTTALDNVVVASNTTANNGVGAGIYVGSATLNMTDSVVQNNHSDSLGGGLYITGMAIISNSEVSNNTSNKNGAGIANFGTLELDGVTLEKNRSEASGGAISTGGTTTILNSTFAINHGVNQGGALFTDSAINLDIDNSTFSANTSDSNGGALHVENSNLTITHSTFSQNGADGRGGAIHLNNPASALINNSIFAGNTATDSHPAIEKVFTSGFNLVDTTVDTGNFNGLGDIVDGTANLAALADNGGPVATMALLDGSDAIDSGQGPQRRDATGVLSNEYVDIGAFEYRTPASAPILRKVFWTDDTGDAIYRANENASHQLSAVQQILATGQTPEDLEFDETTGRIFWVEGTASTGRVLSADVDGRNATILLSSATNPELVVIHGIAVDADTGLLYVTSDGATAVSGTTDKIIAYQLNATGDAIAGAGSVIAEGTASSGTRMHEVYDVDVGAHPVTGNTQLLWADRGATNGSQTDKGYRHWNLTTGVTGSTPYGGLYAPQLPVSVAWNFNEDSYYQTDVVTYQNIQVDPVTMDFTYNGLSGNPSSASGLAYDHETDTLWVSEVGSGANDGRIFTANTTITNGSEVTSLAGVNSPRALALASISRVSIAPIVTENQGATVDEGSTYAISNTDLLVSDADDAPTNLIYNIVTTPQYGFLALSSNPQAPISTFTQADIDAGQVTYSHDDTENFIDQFEFEVTDGVEILTSNTFAINVNEINDHFPLTQNAAMNVSEGGTTTSVSYGTPASITSDLNDLVTDIDTGDSTTFSIDTTTAFGSLTINTDGTFEYNHDGSENFTDSFDYAVEDSAGQRSTGSVSISISPVNDSTPVGVADSISVSEGAQATSLVSGQASVLANDTDSDLPNDSLSATILSAPAYGSLSLNPNGTFAYQHNDTENHTDSFEYTLADAVGNTDTVLVNINITPVNDHFPLTQNASMSVSEGGTTTSVSYGTPASISSDLNDLATDIDTGESTTFSIDTTTAFGTLTINTDGTFEYIHDGSENFTDSFDYAVEDSAGQRSTGSVSISISPVNDSTPVGVADSISVSEGALATSLVSGQASVLANDTDSDLPNDSLSATILSAPAYGSLSLNPNGTFMYEHNGSENLTDSFEYRIEDGLGQSDTALVVITVTTVNDNAPVTQSAIMMVSEGGSTTSVSYGTPSTVTSDLNDLVTDIDTGDSTTFETDTGPAFGVLTINPDGTFQYLHNGSENTADSFVYAARDLANNRSTGVVNITVSPVNDSTPVGVTDTINVSEGGAANTLSGGQASILFNDTDADQPHDTLSASLLNAPGFGSLSLNPDGTFVYQHDGTENHTDSFRYILQDAVGNTDTELVNINITPVNDHSPVTRNATMSVGEGGTTTSVSYGAPAAVTSDLNDLVTDNDIGDAIDFSIGTTTAFGSLTVNPDGTFTYIHNGTENYADSFVYVAEDLNNNRSTGTVNITVSPVNDSTPVGGADTITVTEGGLASTLSSGQTSVLANDTDADLPHDSLSATLLNAPVYGTLTLNPSGTFTYQHDDSENHTDSFEYTVEDALGNMDTVVVSVNINAVNDNIPVTQNANMIVSEGGANTLVSYGSPASVTGDLNDLVTDHDIADSTRFSVDTTTAFGTLTINPDGTFEYLHDGSEHASDSFVYAVTDLGNQRATGTVNIAISPVNDSSPVGVSDSINVAEGGSVTTLASGQTSVLFNDTDADQPDDTLNATVLSNPAFGSLQLNPNGTFVYQHDGSENHLDSFEYTLNDAAGNADSALVNISIAPVNDHFPIAQDASLTVSEGDVASEVSDGPLVSVTSNLGDLVTDIDVGDSVVFSLETPPVFGAVAINADGTFEYSHNGTENFVDSFVYAANDQGGHRSTGTVNITVSPVNDHFPVVQDDLITVDEGGTSSVFDSGRANLLQGLIDPDLPDFATVSLLTDVSHGTLVLSSDNSFEYSHNSSEQFSDSFSYAVTDAAGQSNTVTVAIDIAPINDPPSGQDNQLLIAEDSIRILVVEDFGFSDFSENNNLDSIIISSAPGTGQLKLGGVAVETGATISVANIIAGQLIYHPLANDSGIAADTFLFQVVDDGDNTGIGQNTDPTPNVMTIDLTPVNDGPMALVTEITQSIVQDKFFLWPLPSGLFEDIDDDTLEITISQNDGSALPGWLSFDPLTDTLSGVPGYADVGVLNLMITAQDGGGLSAVVPLSLTVTEVNSPPVSIDLSANTVSENQPGATVGSITIEDIDTQDSHSVTVDDARFIIVDGVLKLIPGAVLDFEAEPQVALMLTATDTANNTLETMVQVSVLNANESPLPDNTDIEASGTAPFSLTLPVDFFTDEDNDTLSYTVTLADGSPLPVWISFDSATRSIVISENAPNIESVTLTVVAADGSNATASENLVVLLQPVVAAATPAIDSVTIAGNAESVIGEFTPLTKDNNKIVSAAESPVPELGQPTEPLVRLPTPDAASAIEIDPVEQSVVVPAAYQPVRSTAFEPPAYATVESDQQVTLPADVVQSLEKLFLIDPLLYQQAYSGLVSNLDIQRTAEQEQRIQLQRVVATSIAASTGLTVGYIVWVLRAGVLLTSVLSSLPAWRMVDPLPVLNNMHEDTDSDDDESLETMVSSGPDTIQPDDDSTTKDEALPNKEI